MLSENEDLKKIQLSCLEILAETIKICEENKLSYYLSGGTLLGAVRNNGFISWDNDVDLIMPREDYNQLIKIANTLLPKNYELQHYSLCKKKEDVKTHHIQIIDKRIEVLRDWTIKKEIINLWIDIFPLDGMPKNKILMLIHYYRYKLLLKIMQISILPKIVNIKKERNKFEKNLIYILKKIYKYNKINTLSILEKMQKIASKYDVCNSKYVCVLAGTYGKKEIVDNIYKEKIKIKFENLLCNITPHYDYVLQRIYGDYFVPKKTNKEIKIV